MVLIGKVTAVGARERHKYQKGSEDCSTYQLEKVVCACYIVLWCAKTGECTSKVVGSIAVILASKKFLTVILPQVTSSAAKRDARWCKSHDSVEHKPPMPPTASCTGTRATNLWKERPVRNADDEQASVQRTRTVCSASQMSPSASRPSAVWPSMRSHGHQAPTFGSTTR